MESSLRMKVVIDGTKADESTTTGVTAAATAAANNSSMIIEDRFSIDKCFACIQIGIQKHGLPQFM